MFSYFGIFIASSIAAPQDVKPPIGEQIDNQEWENDMSVKQVGAMIQPATSFLQSVMKIIAKEHNLNKRFLDRGGRGRAFDITIFIFGKKVLL